MTYFYLVLILYTGHAIVMPQQYTLEECTVAGREARKDGFGQFSCVRAPK